MKDIRRKEKAMESKSEMKEILKKAKYITLALSHNNEPYLVTLSHGYDEKQHQIFFHCAQEGKKIEILHENPSVWGQALIDHGYVQGKCDHLYSTTQFKGKVSFIHDPEQKRYALTVMVNQLEEDPVMVIDEQFTDKALKRVNIGRIDIEYMSGKKSKEVIVSL